MSTGPTNEDRATRGQAHADWKLRVAAVQTNSHDDVPANLRQCDELLARAAEEGARLAVLPECFAFLGAEGEAAAHAERLGDLDAPIQSALHGWARRWKMTIVAGGFPEASGDPARPFNSSVVFDPAGRITATYRKIHLFDVDLADGTSHRESAGTKAGQEPVVADVDGVGVGLSICYDLRFPELFRAEVQGGADVLTVPAAFTLHTGRDHWHALLRARAIENQCWVIAAGQWGRHRRRGEPSNRVSYGHSLIVDPWGTITADCSDGVGLVVATIDAARVRHARSSVPCLAHRRL
jgi:predicted amidohydrolase